MTNREWNTYQNRKSWYNSLRGYEWCYVMSKRHKHRKWGNPVYGYFLDGKYIKEEDDRRK